MSLIEILFAYCSILKSGDRKLANNWLYNTTDDAAIQYAIIDTFNDAGDFISADRVVISFKDYLEK